MWFWRDMRRGNSVVRSGLLGTKVHSSSPTVHRHRGMSRPARWVAGRSSCQMREHPDSPSNAVAGCLMPICLPIPTRTSIAHPLIENAVSHLVTWCVGAAPQGAMAKGEAPSGGPSAAIT